MIGYLKTLTNFDRIVLMFILLVVITSVYSRITGSPTRLWKECHWVYNMYFGVAIFFQVLLLIEYVFKIRVYLFAIKKVIT